MKNEQKIKILNVAKYIIENRATINQTAQEFNMSISSIKKYINDEDKLMSIDIELYNAVKKIQSELIEIGKKEGGHKGKRGPSIDDELANKIVLSRINGQHTLQELSDMYKIPTSTIYEVLKRVKDKNTKDMLESISEAQKTIFRTDAYKKQTEKEESRKKPKI